MNAPCRPALAGRLVAAGVACAMLGSTIPMPAAAAALSDSAWAEQARACAASARELRFYSGTHRIEPEFFSVDAAGIRCESPSRERGRAGGSSLTSYPRPTSVELRLVPWSEISRVDVRSSKPGSGGGALIGLLVGGGLGALAVASADKPKGSFEAVFAAPYYATAAILLVGGGALVGAVIGGSSRDTGWLTCCWREPVAAGTPTVALPRDPPAEPDASEPEPAR